MKAINLFTLLVTLPLASFGQQSPEKKPVLFKAIAKYISHENGEMLSSSKFVVLLKFANNTFEDTVFVLDVRPITYDFDTVLLTVNKYSENSASKKYFSSPDYNARNGVHPFNQGFIHYLDENEKRQWLTRKGR